MDARVLVMQSEAVTAELFATLKSHGLQPHPCPSAQAAATALSEGRVQLLVCARGPGWEALVTRASQFGARSVVLGNVPQAHERREFLPVDVQFAPTIPEVVEALLRIAELPRLAPVEDRLLHAEWMVRAAHSIAGQLDLPTVLQEAMARARELSEADSASLLLVDADTGDLCFDVVSGGNADGYAKLRLKRGEGIAGEVALKARSMLVTHTQQNKTFSSRVDSLTGFVTGSIIAVPLLRLGDVMGVLEAVRSVNNPPFEEKHLKRLQELAPHVAVAVHNAQINEQLRQSQSQVLKDNAALEAKVVERTTQLVHAKQEWEETFDAIREPIALQEGFIVRRANKAYADAAGVPVRMVPGKKCHELLARRDSPCPGCPLVANPDSLKPVDVTFGRTRLYRVGGFKMASPHAGNMVVMQYQDITEQRRLEARLHESERMASVGQLASGAAHEINNPLSFLLSNLETLRESFEQLKNGMEYVKRAATDLSVQDLQSAQAQLAELEALQLTPVLSDIEQMLAESNAGAKRMGAVVRALRELSRLEVTRAESTNVGTSLQRVISQELKSPGLTVKLGTGPDLWVSAPALQLDQALRQILKNAAQAMPQGGSLHVTASEDAAEVRISIRDEGVGIAPENIHRVFEPFFTTRGIGEGMGLGLTAAYGIVKRHGGVIEVESTQGHGATFTIRLPRAEAADGSLERASGG